MTTQNVEGAEASLGDENVIDGAQHKLDDQQGLEKTEPQTQAPDQTALIASLTTQVRGLQGVVDRTQTDLAEIRKQGTADSWKQQIEALPEDQQGIGQLVGSLAQQVAEIGANTQTAQVQQPGTPEEREFVESMGVNPNDQRIAYGQLGAQGGQRAFMDSIYGVLGYQAPGVPQQTVTAPASAVTETQPTVDTPPAMPTPNTTDAINTAYVEGQYDNDPDGATARRNKELAAIGVSPA